MSNDIFAFMIVIFFQNFLNIMTEQDKCHHMFLWFSCPNQDLSYQMTSKHIFVKFSYTRDITILVRLVVHNIMGK